MSDHTEEHPAEHAPEAHGPAAPGGLPPVAIPIVVLLGMLVMVFFTSRILLAVSVNAAPAIALFLALNILVGAALVSAGRWVRERPASFPLILLAGGLVVAGGAVALALGPVNKHEGPEGVPVTIVAKGIAFETADLVVPAGEPLAVEFDNQDAGVDHNVHIFQGADDTGASLFTGTVFPGVGKRVYQVPALEPGPYFFHCDIHTNMTGHLQAEEGASPGPGPGGGPTPPGGPTPEPSGSGSQPPPPSGGPTLVAKAIAFQPPTLTVHIHDGMVTFVFDNQDDGVPHNVVVFDGADDTAPPLYDGEVITGPASVTYSFEAPPPGDYFFHCKIHTNMQGTLTVE
jgi:plastocyanin